MAVLTIDGEVIQAEDVELNEETLRMIAEILSRSD
jgi:hypothetical protein|nr:MAG TPA: hypothetical protein [Caudoviricetes sp.]